VPFVGLGGRVAVVVGQWGTLQMCLGCRQPQTSLTSFPEPCEKGLQLVYSISIINELLGIFVASKDNGGAGESGPEGSRKDAEQSQLPRMGNLMYKYNLPHTQTLMWLAPLGPAGKPIFPPTETPTSILLALKTLQNATEIQG